VSEVIMHLRTTQQNPRNREGFALPMAILVIGFMTAGIIAAFTRVGAEAQTVSNQQAQTAAFAVADAGLADWMAAGRLPNTTNTAQRTFIYGNDSAVVHARRIRPPATGESLVLISSTGFVRGGAARAPARRTVAQFATQQPMDMQVLSSWTSLSGISKNGNSGGFHGDDAAGTQCGDGVTRAGISVPDGMSEGTHQVATGDPAVDEMGTKQEMADQIDIDWVSITDPASPSIVSTSGLVICDPGSVNYIQGYGPCGGTLPTNFTDWPTVVVNGDFTFPGGVSGRGLLIITGNLTMLGASNWEGVILVGGKIVDNGQGEIAGSVISGLNLLKGETVAESEVDISTANGQKRYQFDSCAVQNALSGATSGMRPIQNAWVDNWSTW
jgi:hypothetical protein